MNTPLLDRIRSPKDLKELELQELTALSAELRSVILATVSENGGHLASNLGVVELTVALHRIFQVPEDRILWDVGHQSYVHKLLTGRAETFHTLRKTGGVSGFCNPQESPCDAFISGHAGNAVSAAMGMAVSNRMDGKDAHVVAVLGDGALVNGISLEALNNLESATGRMIVVLNDNKMSISHSTGAIPRYLNRLITGRGYNQLKSACKRFLAKLPGGKKMIRGIQRWESAVKNLVVPATFFEEMGIRYVGPIDGHDLKTLIRTFDRVRDFTRPVLVHVITEKGHGCDYAMRAPEQYHGVSAFDPANGNVRTVSGKTTFSNTFGETLFALAQKDPRVVAITAAMASGCGITKDFVHAFPDRFFDVGIAEEHALIFAAGLAAGGKRPVVAMYATFLQRALDCVFHDICLQNLPVLLCIDRAGIVEDGPTHHGIQDLGFLGAMPNLAILTPENESILAEMMHLALEQDRPVAIRYPRGNSGPAAEIRTPPVRWGHSCCLREGTDLAIWASGKEAGAALETALILEQQYGLSCAVYSVRFLKPFDREAFLACAQKMPVVTLEDHSLHGGLADIAARILTDVHHCGFFSFGWDPEKIVPHGSGADLRKNAGLLPGQIAETLNQKIRKIK